MAGIGEILQHFHVNVMITRSLFSIVDLSDSLSDTRKLEVVSLNRFRLASSLTESFGCFLEHARLLI